ncbi:hypothetical protein RND81_12G153500 [Saponaria officinalis]|uniref:Magnesium transporter n=1 Tax=Saponaria officinalis TaxID=3572 RepID=A0AAW1HAY1_SAPOF
MATTQQPRRRQGIGTRVWLVVSEAADLRRDEVTKSHIMRRTGLPARDLRVLDPVLTYPSTILGRERAIVINLEHIKAIVTATEVLMVNSNNPLVVDFVDDLLHRISGGVFQQAKETNDPYRGVVESIQREDSGATLVEPLGSGPKSLPFEFKALEACLESACKCLESETSTLEQEAYPALDELSSHISTLNLERVRQIKSRLVAISGRVQKVRDELEHLLDDDNDMAEMYLTEKLKQSMEQMSFREEPEKDDAGLDEETDDDSSKSGRNSDAVTYAKPNVEELEMLLEAYFAQVDGISQKLSTVSRPNI